MANTDPVIAVFMAGAGTLLLYCGIKNQNPIDILKSVAAHSPSTTPTATGAGGGPVINTAGGVSGTYGPTQVTPGGATSKPTTTGPVAPIGLQS